MRSVERVEEGDYEIVSEHRPVRVRIGARYPARLAALNPPDPSGDLRTIDPETKFVIRDAKATTPGAFDNDPNDLLDDFEDGFETRLLGYQPGYNEYQEAPETNFEHSLLYNQFRDTDLVVKDQRLINDKRLNVVLFSGDLSRTGGQAITLDPETLDGPTAPIEIEAANDNIEFTIPTETPELWASEDVIGEEFDEGEPHARVPTPGAEDDRVTIELEAGETYQLRVARVGFDGGSVDDEQFTPVQYERTEPGGEGGDETLPGPRVDVNSDDESLEEGDTFDIRADVSSVGKTGEDNWRGGTTIQAAEWYIQGDDPGEGNANPMEAVDGEYLNDVELEVEDEISADDLEEGTNTLVIRGQDSRGVWGDDTDSVKATVEEADFPPGPPGPPGDVNFVANDIEINNDSQTFSFEPEMGNNNEAIIDLSSAQGDTINYTGGEVEFLQQSNNNDRVEYDQENDQIIFTARGNKGGDTIEIVINGINVVGNVGDASTVDYGDDSGAEDSDAFEITD
ncbi:hypothetical protein [Natronomonas salsuginis]|uniref:Uncharacterized protein n=1 Tax=Natronomonas salsuginis TaxID=2217661 RepID=A0A4U5JCT7_9EURY|nr:hypothetical protein [Natronomonas salsuginis]TKR26101.1 hypothetical protein DM868_06295 [Natronomonas salsuginis]